MGPRERDAQARLNGTPPKSKEQAERMSDRVWEARARDKRERRGRSAW
jgi:hypothetical protein